MICATLLFVVVFAHIGARQKIATQEIIYLEYFHIVMYFAILWVAVNAILMILKPEPWITRYEDNLFSRVLFWPLTPGALWLATLGTFYWGSSSVSSVYSPFRNRRFLEGQVCN